MEYGQCALSKCARQLHHDAHLYSYIQRMDTNEKYNEEGGYVLGRRPTVAAQPKTGRRDFEVRLSKKGEKETNIDQLPPFFNSASREGRSGSTISLWGCDQFLGELLRKNGNLAHRQGHSDLG